MPGYRRPAVDDLTGHVSADVQDHFQARPGLLSHHAADEERTPPGVNAASALQGGIQRHYTMYAAHQVRGDIGHVSRRSALSDGGSDSNSSGVADSGNPHQLRGNMNTNPLRCLM